MVVDDEGGFLAERRKRRQDEESTKQKSTVDYKHSKVDRSFQTFSMYNKHNDTIVVTLTTNDRKSDTTI
jgi:hypothetical protein